MVGDPFLIGLPLSKDVVGRAVGPSYFSEKVSVLASAGVAALSFSFNRPLPQSGRASDNFGFIWCCPYLSTIKYFTRKGSKSGNLLPVSLPKCKFYFPVRPLPELDLAKVYRTYQHREKILSSCLCLPILR